MGTEWTTTSGTYTQTFGDSYDASFVPMSASAVVIPHELTVCQLCGVEEVIVFCDECKGILQLARKKWAETMMEEIEDALS